MKTLYSESFCSERHTKSLNSRLVINLPCFLRISYNYYSCLFFFPLFFHSVARGHGRVNRTNDFNRVFRSHNAVAMKSRLDVRE